MKRDAITDSLSDSLPGNRMTRGSNSLHLLKGLEAHSIHNNADAEATTMKGPATSKTSCYERQQRYREKKRQYLIRLESTVRRLRMDVDQQLVVCDNTKKALSCDQLMVTQQYWDGSTKTSLTQPGRMTAAEMVTIMRDCMQSFVSGVQDKQAKFLESAMRSDVHHGDFVGRGNILEQWMRFCSCFDGAAPGLEHCVFKVHVLEPEITVGHVSSVLLAHLTYRSLAAVFPQALADTTLRDKLLQTSTIRVPMTALFQFDEQGKVYRYDSTVDFVSGLHAALGDYWAVVKVLQSANIDDTGHIRGDFPWNANEQLRASPTCHHLCCATEWGCKFYRPTALLDERLSVAFLLSSADCQRLEATDSDASS
ncbi:unnamed protein product [Phytophthora lilii]|uniref:Unnamed protein product n=1 Tax=Phytophthora lilii TaxID=2077276 RepID=A0A9W6WUE8_9STRA|nr:unnamed protein product [Phytophthora lilii]